MGKTLAEKVWKFIQKHHLISPGEVLLVGVSGGTDSVGLLHLLVTLQPRLKVKLYVAHLNHMLRGAESQADAEYVSGLCQHLGVPVVMEQREVEIYRAKHHCSPEEAAREVRYCFFAEVAGSVGARKVAVGHNAGDQGETILMHLIRGTGAEGLGGMQPAAIWRSPGGGAELIIVRPLLEVEREEIDGYCEEHKLAPREDSSNISLSYFRNRVRHQLVPLLQSYNPKWREALLHTAHILAGETAFFEEQVSLVWNMVVEEHQERIVLDTKELLTLHPALQRHLLRTVLRKVLGDLRDIEWKHIESLRRALEQPTSKMLSLPRGLVFVTQYDRGIITVSPTRWCPFPPLGEESQLKVPGETILPGWKVVATIHPVSGQPFEVEPVASSSAPNAKWFTGEASRGGEAPLDDTIPLSPPSPKGDLEGLRAGGIRGMRLISTLRACLDFQVSGGELWVRQRRPGDRFQPSGMKQPKKLQDFMVDVKIPRLWRDHVPLVCSPEHILWVVGWRISELGKTTPYTRQALCLEFIPLLPRSASSS